MKYTFTIGLNDKTTKVQQINSVEAFKMSMNLIGKIFGGGTIYESQGFYTHDDGTMVIEKSLIVHTFYEGEDGENKVLEFVSIIKKILNQESIMIERTDTKIDFL